MRVTYLGTERRGSGGAGGGELVSELGTEGGQHTAVGRAAAEGGGGSQPPQEHGARRRDGMQNCRSICKGDPKQIMSLLNCTSRFRARANVCSI